MKQMDHIVDSNKKATALQLLIAWGDEKLKTEPMKHLSFAEVIDKAEALLEVEKEQMGYSKEDVIKIVEKSRETGLTAEYLLLTYKK